MKKHTSEEAFYQRMNDLAESNKSVKSKTNSLGTLVDYQKAGDGINYGIIKENHNYYIKNGGIKSDPNASDFTYIGGLSNITEYQYKTLAEAKKIRNMLFQTISEGLSIKFEKKSNKISLNENINEETEDDDISEDKAEDEIDAADSKMPDLDVATEKAKEEPEVDMGIDSEMGLGDEEMETPEDDEESMNLGDDVDGEMKEIEKLLGKITNKIRNVEMTEPQVKYSVNTFLAAFKDKFPEVEVEDRKEMANKILKVVDDEDIESIGDEVESGEEEIAPDEMGAEGEVVSDEEEMNEADACNECGDFAKYAESKGYTKESIKECEREEMSNLISGYANAHNDGKNDGDFDSVALYTTPEITETLVNEYGHDDYAEKLTSSIDTLNETTDEDKQIKIDELWGGLSQLGKKAGQAVGSAAQKVAKKVGDTATGIKQTYHAGEKNVALGKLEKIAADLGRQIAAVNQRGEKAGHEPINVNSILTTIKNQVGKTGTSDLSKFRTAESVEENIEEDVISEKVEGISKYLKYLPKLKGEDKEKFTKLQNQMWSDKGISDEDMNKMVSLLKNAGNDNIEEGETIDEGKALLDVLSKVKYLSPENKKQYESLYNKIMSTITSGEDLDKDDMDKMNNILSDKEENGVNEEIRSTLSDLHGLIKDLSPEGKKEYEKVYKELVNTGELNKEDQEVLKPENESKIVENKEKPSAGLTKKQKSDVVKKAKAGKDIGKTGKNFKKIEKEAEKSGADDPTAVAAAAMWKNVKREGKEEKKEAITETEVKVRKYIRNRIQEKQGLKKTSLNENKKSKKMKSLDAIIDKELKTFGKKSK